MAAVTLKKHEARQNPTPTVFLGRPNLRLALLAPDMVEAILGGTLNQSVILDRLEKGVPVEWEEQRTICCDPSNASRWAASTIAEGEDVDVELLNSRPKAPASLP